MELLGQKPDLKIIRLIDWLGRHGGPFLFVKELTIIYLISLI